MRMEYRLEKELNFNMKIDVKLDEIISGIETVDENIKNEVTKKFDKLAIPIGSLGELQSLVTRICIASHDISANIDKRAVVVFCADNGVVEEGVSQVGHEVTTAVARNLCKNNTVMCKMAEFAKIDVIPVDIGMKENISNARLINKKVANSTKNILKEKAMTKDEAVKTIENGIEVAISLYEKGYKILLTGEMGIGNTTTSTAIASVVLGLNSDEITGVGAGLSPEGLLRKKEVIRKAVELHKPDKNDVIDILSKIGGFDIAGMIGLILGSAYCKIPCVIDGFISNVSALCANMLCENARDYMIFSHETAEVGGVKTLEKLSAKPVIKANMRLGEGSGAIAIMPLIDMTMKIYNEMITFSDIEIDDYKPL